LTKVKICGLSEVEHAVSACEAGADFVGFVFAPSKRRVSPVKALEIVKSLQNITPHPELVGVFANFDIDKVNEIARFCRLDWVQLSGSESNAYCKQVERPVIKVIHIADGTTVDEITDEIETGLRSRKKPTIYLLDTQQKGVFGGTGTTFNWEIARLVSARFRIMIAGGLGPENVGKLIQDVRPWGVDVSSGIETGGIKDIAKIKLFIQIAKNGGG
jgi:phosphoribosylanthranilate isomerase